MADEIKEENTERRGRILDAAADLITHYGYDKTTVSDIAREAGVSKGAIYLHFDSKEALFEALLLRAVRRYSARWFELVEADPQGGTMAGIYKNILYALRESPFMMALFKRDTHVLGSYVRKPDNRFRSAGGMRTEFLQMMQATGAIRPDVDVKVMAHIMNIFSYGLVSIDEVVEADTIPPLDDVIETMGEMMDRMLAPESNENANEAGKAVVRQLMAASQQHFADEPETTDD